MHYNIFSTKNKYLSIQNVGAIINYNSHKRKTFQQSFYLLLLVVNFIRCYVLYIDQSEKKISAFNELGT